MNIEQLTMIVDLIKGLGDQATEGFIWYISLTTLVDPVVSIVIASIISYMGLRVASLYLLNNRSEAAIKDLAEYHGVYYSRYDGITSQDLLLLIDKCKGGNDI